MVATKMFETPVPLSVITLSKDTSAAVSATTGNMKENLGLGIDPNNLTSLNDIQEAFQKLCQEEKLIEERLEWSVSNRHQLEARLAQVSKLLPTLQVVHNDACQLQNTISVTQQLATKVSARVRRLDIAKRGVVDVQSRVGDLLDLEGCAGGVATALHQEDYETAAAHIHRFLAMDETLLLHSAAEAGNKGTGSIEKWFERLRGAERELSVLIEHRFDEAVSTHDIASVDRFFKLFPLLNRKQQGLLKFSAFLCAKIQETGEAVIERCRSSVAAGSSSNKRAAVLWADAATELFETVARIVEVRQPIIETYYGPGQLVLVVTELVSETDRQAGRIIAEMRTNRRLDALTTAVNDALSHSGALSSDSMVGTSMGGVSSMGLSTAGGVVGVGSYGSHLPDPRSLDTLLGELTLLNARADLFLRFMKRRVVADLEASIVNPDELKKQTERLETKLWRSQVACDMAVVIGQYTILEQYYLNQSFAKALTMDTPCTAALPHLKGEADTIGAGGSLDGGSLEDASSVFISSIVDDAFYIIKKSVRRAIASSSVDGVCAVLNHAVTLIETQLATGFQQTLKRGFPAQGYMDISQAYSAFQMSLQTGKLSSSTPEADALRQTFLTALNNAETSQRHVLSLEDGLQEAVTATMTGLSANSKDKLESCLGDLRNSGCKLQSVTEFGLTQLRATAVKPRVKSWMHNFSSTSHDVTEEEFACYEAHDPFSESLIMNVDGVLGSFRPLLTRPNLSSLTAVVVQEVATHLELAMMKMTYNRLGGLLVDREVRAVVTYLSQIAQWSVREQLARITQMATLLNLDHLHEVEEYSSGHSWRLTAAEMRKTLQLRVDFKFEDIKRLKL
uniref:Conserved oligomeric Golgi complex subunit 4 n=1 Tax=Hirondellea gigas TaxID=1518452 RepID=A0A2P2I5A5_9CRUS